MKRPMKASQVKLTPSALGKSEEDLRREKITKAVRARQARAEALRRSGALDGPTSGPDMERGLESRLSRVNEKAALAFKAKAAVAAKLNKDKS